MNAQIVVQLDVRENVQAGVSEIAHGVELREPAVGQAQLVGKARAERMVVRCRRQPVPLRKRAPECGQLGTIVDRVRLIEYDAAAQLVLVREVVIHGAEIGKEIRVLRTGNGEDAERDVYAVHFGGAAGALAWGGLYVLLEDRIVRLVEVRHLVQQREPGRSRGAGRKRRRKGLPQRGVFKIAEIEELVFLDRSAHGSAQFVLVETRGFADPRVDELCIHGIQVAVLKVLVEAAMQLVGAVFQDGVELSARGVPEFGAKLILQQREFLSCLGWNIHQRTGNGLIVVVNALDHEVVVHRALAADRWARSLTHAAIARHAGAQQRQLQRAVETVRVFDDRKIHRSDGSRSPYQPVRWSYRW